MAQIDTVLFDYDGTLVDTNRVVLESWQHTFRTLEVRERPDREVYKTFGEPIKLTMKKFFPAREDYALEVYRSWQSEHFQDYISLFPGILPMLKELRKKDVKIGLVTSRLESSTYQGLNSFGIADCFDAVVTAN